ncbi:MAG: Uma2 family endonuclease [Dolichospermum sp.]|nr:Uma2 family endonuclease [Dolichospermum sp.]
MEVDITHTDINKLKFYASMGVTEFWRYNGQIIRIYQLQNHQYIEVEKSPTFFRTIKEQLYQFLQDCQIDKVQFSKSFSAWVQQEIQN